MLENIGVNLISSGICFLIGIFAANYKIIVLFLKSLIHWNRDVRFSIAYLYKIKINDKYLLIKGSKIEQLQPIGGVYKTCSSFSTIERKLNIIFESEQGFYERNDLRFCTKGKNIRKVLKWFDSRENREVAVYREFYEEIIKEELGLDITLRTYQNWENPNNEIKSKPALLLAEYFRVNVGYLLGEDERRTNYLSSTIEKYSDNMESPVDFAGYGLLALTRGEKVRDTVIENLREITDYYGHRSFSKEEFKNWNQEKKDFMLKEIQDYADANIGRFLAGLMTFPDKTKITIIDFLTLDKKDREALSTIISSLADNPVLHKDYND